MTVEIRNARISGTQLGVEDHGVLTAFLNLDYGKEVNGAFEREGSSQGFGGYYLDSYDQMAGKRVPYYRCGLFVRRVLETVGVDDWEDLKHKYVRVKMDGWRIQAIGHIISDRWFDPEAEFKDMEGE